MLIGYLVDDKISNTPTNKSIAKDNRDTFKHRKNTDREKVEILREKDCAEFIQCLSAKTIAKEYSRTEMWAVKNYKVNVWEKTSANGKGKKVGEMMCNSRALIIDKSGDDYKILSPLDNSIGWVNKIQIEDIVYQNPNTYQKCRGY